MRSLALGSIPSILLWSHLLIAAAAKEPWRVELDKLFLKNVTMTPGQSVTTPSTTESIRKVTDDGEVDLKPTKIANEVTDCQMEDGHNGVCVVYYQCDSVSKQLITDGDTLIDIRIMDRPCPQYLHVCCKRDLINKTTPSVPTGGNTACGYSNPGASAFRISSQEYAEFGEYPWMVAVLKKNEQGIEFTPKNYLGGGSLIHPSVILTSAHKVDGLEAHELSVRAGEWDTQTEDETYPYQQRDVAKIITHEDFYRPSVLNSVALLIADKPFVLAPHIDVICLGKALPPPNTLCYSMGWGKEDFGNSDKYAVALKKVPLPLVSRQRCRDALRGTRLGAHFVLHKSFTCAGGKPGVDTCRGDGGAPLVCEISNGRYAMYGTVAWGIGCGEGGIPGIYTDVTQFRDWVVEKVRQESYSPDVFQYSD